MKVSSFNRHFNTYCNDRICTMNEEIVVRVSNVSFSYPDKNNAVCDVSFTASKGERIGIIGPNGAGKTTLFLIMCGILKPAQGTVQVNGNGIVPHAFNPEITYLFQSPDDQLFSSTVYDDVAFGPMNMNITRESIKDRVENALEKVNLSEVAHKAPNHLSGGEKRMAAIATILSMLPDVILFDEPTSNLDSKNRRDLINTLLSIDKLQIIASHDLEFILETCSRVMIMDKGCVEADGSSADIMSDTELMNKYHMEKPHSLYPHSHGEKTERGPTRKH